MRKDMSWRKAIESVLKEARTSLHYKEIAEQIVSRGLRQSVGATPAATVSANLTVSIKKEGDSSPFIRTGKGEYAMRPDRLATAGVPFQPEREADSEDEEEKQYGIVTSFGMFWRRSFVQWSTQARLLGVQQMGAEPVDFCNQIGIYLLYDGREVIYVGRAVERPLGRRLYEHGADRLSTRWDRFSWFGLLPVSEDGKLGTLPKAFASDELVPAIEAILIEALEPRQNRKRGDDLSAVEYLQQEDPEIEKARMRQTLDALARKAL